MPVDIGPKIGIQGEREFRNQINQTNQALKTLAAEGKAVTSSFDAETTAEQKAAAQKDVLNRKIETQKDKLALLEKGLRESAQMYGEADTRTMKWQQAVHEATAQLNGMEKELQDVDKGVDETTDSMEQAGEATRGWADVMKGQLLADAVKTGMKKIADFAKDAASAMWEASKAGAAYADDILTLATTTGLSTDELQELKYMSDFVDVSLETVTGSLTKLTANMAKAQTGEGEMAEAFQALGVAVTDGNGRLRRSKDVFRDMITALGQIDDETERDVVAMKIFGKSAKDLNPMIAAGADEMDALAKEAKDAGYVLSGPALQALGKQNDAMARLDKRVEALKNSFAAGLAPGVTKAYDTIGEAMDNPRVQRSVELLGQGIGNIIGKAADLAAKVLPDLMAAFSDDVRLRTFTDREIELAQKTDEAAEAFRNLMDTYAEKAKPILDEKERVQNLWKEMQTLVDENGFVLAANKDRVDYILNELNEALGTEYERNGAIIKQYQDMQKEIESLIQQRTAEKLLAAGEEEFTAARAAREEALQRAGEWFDIIESRSAALKKAEEERVAFWKLYQDQYDEGDEETRDSILRKAQAYETAVYNARDALAEARNEYDVASNTAQEYYNVVEKYERAQTAMLQGNYDLAVGLLSDELGATLSYYREKEKLDEKDKNSLIDKILKQEQAIAEYKRNLEKGVTGFSQKGLKEMEDYVWEARRILNGSTGKGIGTDFILGIVKGLEDNETIKQLKEAAQNVGKTVSGGTKATLQIASPSKLGKWMGQMWDEGLILGLEEKEAALAKAASSLAGTIATASNPVGIGAYSYGYGNAMTAAGSASTSSYTTNLGGITIQVPGAGAVNEDVLAQRVVTRLTAELNRTQRGGRR